MTDRLPLRPGARIAGPGRLFDSTADLAQASRLVLSGAEATTGRATGNATAAAEWNVRLAPRLEVACHIAMCPTMAYMLALIV